MESSTTPDPPGEDKTSPLQPELSPSHNEPLSSPTSPLLPREELPIPDSPATALPPRKEEKEKKEEEKEEKEGKEEQEEEKEKEKEKEKEEEITEIKTAKKKRRRGNLTENKSKSELGTGGGPSQPWSSQGRGKSVSYRHSKMSGSLVASVPESGLLRKRHLIIEEIISTERAYVHSLKTLIGLWVLPLQVFIGDKEKEVLTENDHRVLFSNVVLLLGVNEQLLEDLIRRYNKWESESTLPQSRCIGDIFESIAPMMKLYTQYCNNYSIAQEKLHELQQNNKKFLNFQKQMRDLQDSSLDIDSFLIMPIQRIPRYILLLQDLLSHTPGRHVDYTTTKSAIEKLEEVANHANTSIGDVKNTEMILKIQDQLVGFPIQDQLLQPARKYVKEGELIKIMSTRVKPTWFILFSDVIIYGYRRIGGKIQYKGTVAMGTTWVRDLEDTQTIQNLFQIVAVEKTYTVYAETPEIKAEWMEELNNVIGQILKKHPQLKDKRAPVRIRNRGGSIWKNLTYTPGEFDPNHSGKTSEDKKWLTVENDTVYCRTDKQNVFDTYSAPSRTDERTKLLISKSGDSQSAEDEACCCSCIIL